MTLGLTNAYGASLTHGGGLALQAPDGGGFVFLKSQGSSAIAVDAENATVTVRTTVANWTAGQERSAGFIVYPSASQVSTALTNAVAEAASPLVLRATGVVPGVGELPNSYDGDRGYYRVQLPTTGVSGNDGILRAHVAITNATSIARTARINFDGTDSRPMLLLDIKGKSGQWCGNFGGAQFLRYFDPNGTQRRHSRMRTRYERYCPNLAEVVFAGVTDDGAMQFSYSAGLFRSDDYTRGVHRLRVDVKRDTPFSRLVFFQQAADTYDYNNGTTLAYGDARRIAPLRQWAATFGRNANVGEPVALTGPMPWAMTLDSVDRSENTQFSFPARLGAAQPARFVIMMIRDF